MAGLFGLGSLIQAGLGIGQMIGGAFMKNPKLPEYDIPTDIKSNLNDAYMNRNQGLSDPVKSYLTQESQRAGASAIAANTSRRGGLGLIASVAQQQADSANRIGQMDEQRRIENMNRLFAARDTMAKYKDKAFDIKYQNIQEKRMRRQQMLGAGMQNVAGAMGTMDMASALAGDTKNIFEKGGLFGKK